jgi:hypothetical protein
MSCASQTPSKNVLPGHTGLAAVPYANEWFTRESG